MYIRLIDRKYFSFMRRCRHYIREAALSKIRSRRLLACGLWLLSRDRLPLCNTGGEFSRADSDERSPIQQKNLSKIYLFDGQEFAGARLPLLLHETSVFHSLFQRNLPFNRLALPAGGSKDFFLHESTRDFQWDIGVLTSVHFN